MLILGGIFTATEAASVAVLYSAILAACYRGLNRRDVLDILVTTGRVSGIVLGLVGVASVLGYVMAYDEVSNSLRHAAAGLTGHYFLFVLFLILVFGSSVRCSTGCRRS